MGTNSEAARAELCSLQLFDESWYAGQKDIAGSGLGAFKDYLIVGWAEGHSPNRFFDSHWYLLTNLDVSTSGLNPLVHYWEFGEAEGRWPCRIFDPIWYSQKYGVPYGGGRALSHYLSIGNRQNYQPSELFDPLVYLKSNPDVAEAGCDPVLHYLKYGYLESRELDGVFATRWYRAHYLAGEGSIDPLWHYLTLGRAKGLRPTPSPIAMLDQSEAPPDDTQNDAEQSPVAEQIRLFTNPGPNFEEFDPTIIKSGPKRAKIIAFYLPQFHSIPENDQAWGKGFTEWRNTQRGVPRFVGHQQPRVPRDLGFYDLTNPRVLRQQVELAKASGIHGFGFYYYHFDGKRVLEKPLEQFLSDRTLDFPFLIIWANENWTRRWDGENDDVILWQHYKDEYEDVLLADWSRHFSDPRYIRAGGRPLLIIYRPGIIPEARQKIDHWRRRLKEEFDHEPWILMAQGFGDLDPQPYGLDGAIEFPPHKVAQDLPRLNSQVVVYDPRQIGQVIAYRAVIERSLGEPQPNFPLIKTLSPSWDNDCRRQGRGLVMQGSTPKLYQRWLEELIWRSAKRPFAGESFVFVNAWNEWAEAAYLEPDVYSGSAYLNATARAIVGHQAAPGKPEIALVGHDAHRHGAQLLLLHLGRLLAKRFGLRVTFLLLDGGPLLEQYREIGELIVASAPSAEMRSAIEKLQHRGTHLAITNTLVTGSVVPELRRKGFRVVSLVHELPRIARERFLEAEANAIAAYSDIVVCAADMVATEFGNFTGLSRDAIEVAPQGLYLPIETNPADRAAVRAELRLPKGSLIVLGVAFADLRKGIDLFLSTARAAASRGSTEIYYVWVGNADPVVETWLLQEQNLGHLPNFRRADRTNDLGRYYGAADALFLSSREDPFPSTILEALSCGLPIFGFDGCSGSQELIREHGAIVPPYDIVAAAETIDRFLAEEQSKPERAAARRRTIEERFRFDRYGFRLLQFLEPRWRPVSVVVPNYNYGRYLKARMASVFEQEEPVFEVIVLDDCSNDRSLEALERIRRESGREFSVIANPKNSGSVMSQWYKAAECASGEFIWIAEADDVAKKQFLRRLLQFAQSEDILFAFSDSAQIDGEGNPLADSYNYYYAADGADTLAENTTMPAREFAKKYLAVRNLIMNVSAMIARREPLLETLRDNLDTVKAFKFAGDWRLYAELCLKEGRVAYVAESLNVHRRHLESAVHSTRGRAHVEEIRRVHDYLEKTLDGGAADFRRTRYLQELQAQFGLEIDHASPGRAAE